MCNFCACYLQKIQEYFKCGYYFNYFWMQVDCCRVVELKNGLMLTVHCGQLKYMRILMDTSTQYALPLVD